jgi:tetratricopeptide (TPR) repeat protein
LIQSSHSTKTIATTRPAAADHAAALSHLKNGVAALDDLDDAQAMTELNTAIQLDPTLAEAYWQRARAVDDQGNADQARADREQAIKLGFRPAPEALATWAGGRGGRGGRRAGAAGQNKAILTRMQRNIVQERLSVTLADEPAGPRITLMRVEPAGVAGLAGFKAGDVLEQPAPAAAPNILRVLSDPAANAAALKRPDGQVITLQLPPVSPESARNLAFARRAEFAQTDPAHPVLLPPDVLFGHQAVAPATQPAQGGSTNPQADLAAIRAELLIVQGQYDQALSEYTDAIKLDPANPNHRIGRGQVLFHLSRTDDAIADYTEAIRLSPQNAAALRLRSLAYTAAGDNAKAQSDAATADALDARAGQ